MPHLQVRTFNSQPTRCYTIKTENPTRNSKSVAEIILRHQTFKIALKKTNVHTHRHTDRHMASGHWRYQPVTNIHTDTHVHIVHTANAVANERVIEFQSCEMLSTRFNRSRLCARVSVPAFTLARANTHSTQYLKRFTVKNEKARLVVLAYNKT